MKRVFNVQYQVHRFIAKTFPETWIGVQSKDERYVIFNNMNSTPITLNRKDTSLELTKVAWDLNIPSPRGFTSKGTDREMLFSCYIEDFSNVEKLSKDIWNKLEESNNVIRVE